MLWVVTHYVGWIGSDELMMMMDRGRAYVFDDDGSSDVLTC